nr:MAG: ORF1b protein [Rhinolophus pusillus astrovirus]
MHLGAWKYDLEIPTRKIVPVGFPVYGNIKIDRPIVDYKKPIDPLIGLLPRPPKYVPRHAPTVWGRNAYSKSFEKFFYAKPCDDISGEFPREWGFASYALYKEYNFLMGSHIIPITATVKNSESTPGYPKFKYWKTEEEYLEERGFEDYVKQVEDIKSGDRPDVLWYLFLKKEILKIEKIQEEDIRQIVCSDPIYARIGAMFEQDQNNRMKRMTRWRQGQCGWSPFEGGFDEIMKRIEKEDNQYIELDWTRFDGTIPVEVFRHIKDFRFKMLSKEYKTKLNKDMYDWYVDQLCKRYVLLPSGEVTIQERGNPSGQISTTMDNNMVNTFLQAFEFAYMHGSYDDEKLRREWDKCDALVYGDDRISSWPSVPPNYVDRVVEMYKEVFGMWVKPEKVVIRNELDGVSFCGFTAILTDGMYLPVPNDAWKFITSTLTPVKALPNFDALVGKVLSFQVLVHNLPEDDPVKQWFEDAYANLARHACATDQEPLPVLTREMREFLWRGGPKKRDGGHRS